MVPDTLSRRGSRSRSIGSTERPMSLKAMHAESNVAWTSSSTVPSALCDSVARRNPEGRIQTASLKGLGGGGAQWRRWRPIWIANYRTSHHIEHQRNIAHPATHGSRGRVAMPSFALGGRLRNPASRRLQADDAAAGRRNSNGTAAVRACVRNRFIPEATAAAGPPLDPSAVCAGFHGLRAGGQSPPSVVGRPPNSSVAVLPSMIPPAVRSRRATSESYAGM
jgi:hypothetical protein